jgi:hypothetical protein
MDDQHQKTPETDKNHEGSHSRARNRTAEPANAAETPRDAAPANVATANEDEQAQREGAGAMVGELMNSDTVNQATTMVRNVGEQVWSAASNAGGTAQELARQARDQVSGMMNSSTRAGEYVTRNVNEYPLAALLIAGAVGYGLAYLFHNSWQGSDAAPSQPAKRKSAASDARR